MSYSGIQWFVDRVGKLRSNSAGRYRTLVMVVAVGLFASGTLFAWRQLPSGQHVVHWIPLLLACVLGVPAMIALNASEYRAMARLASIDVAYRVAIQVAVLGSAANLAPLPGAVLVRWQHLSLRGVRAMHAVNVNVVAGGIWLTISSLVVFVATVGESIPVAILSAAIGVAACVATLAVQKKMRFSSAWRELVLIEVGIVAVSAFRALMILVAFDLGGDWRAPLAIAGSYALANVVGIFPGGLGLRELLSGLTSRSLVGDVSTGFLVAAVDRVIGLVIHLPFALVLMKRDRAQAGLDYAEK